MIAENVASGRRLTPEEIKNAISSLRIWQSSSKLLENCEELMDVLDSEYLFNQPGLNFLRDAWVGATFASIKFPLFNVRLPQGQWPDIEIDGSPARQFEIVEALMPGRRRGLEYRRPGHWRDYPVSEWHAAVDAIPGALGDAARLKASKKYRGGRCGLIIYLNVGSTFGLRREETIAAIPVAIEPARQTFDDVYILWDNVVY